MAALEHNLCNILIVLWLWLVFTVYFYCLFNSFMVILFFLMDFKAMLATLHVLWGERRFIYLLLLYYYINNNN